MITTAMTRTRSYKIAFDHGHRTTATAKSSSSTPTLLFGFRSTRGLVQARAGGPRGSRVGTIVPRGMNGWGAEAMSEETNGLCTERLGTSIAAMVAAAAAKGQTPELS